MILLLVSAAAILACSAAETNTSYIITTPSVVRPLRPITFSYFILSSVTNPVTVQFELLDSTTSTSVIKQSNTLTPGQSGTFEMEAPKNLLSQSYSLRLLGSGGVTFNETKQVRVERKSFSVFIQTDKAIYKPSQTVKFRAFAVQPDLKTYIAPITLKILDKDDNLMMQWKNQTTSTGLVSKEFELSEQPPLGNWKVEALLGGEKTIKTFKVDEYVLPKFEVKVHMPTFMTENIGELKGYIEAKYTFGQSVNGKVKYRVSRSGYRMTTIQVEAELVNGKADFSFDKQQLSQLKSSGERQYCCWGKKTIVIQANVTEEATGKMLSDKASVMYERASLKIDFLDSTPDTFKKAMSYVVFMKVSQPDGSPPDTSKSLSVNLNQIWSWNIVKGKITESGRRTVVEQVAVPPSGLIVHKLSVLDMADSLSLRATIKDKFNKSISVGKSVSGFKSRDDQGLQITMLGDSSTVLPGQSVPFSMNASDSVSDLMVQILSKGVIANSLSYRVGGKKTYDFTISFDAAMARRTAPSARLVAWYFTDKGEIITDSIEFNVEGTFQNEVSLDFNINRTMPGKEVTLNVMAAPQSVVGLLAVDQSVLLMGTGNDVTQDDVKAELAEYDSSGTRYPIMPFFGRPIGRPGFAERGRKKRSMCYRCWWPIFVGGKDAKEMLSNAGILVFTDAYVHDEKPKYGRIPWSPIPERGPVNGQRGPAGPQGMPGAPAPAPPPPLSATASPPLGGNEKSESVEETKIRQEFPETWIWAEEASGTDGKAALKYTAPDTMTSWVATAFALHGEQGLGVAGNPGKVTVFKPFFVSLTLPYSLIRQEEFVLNATVFNYLPNPQQVLVTLKKSQHFDVKIRSANGNMDPIGEDISHTLTVPSNDAKTVSFWIIPKSLGMIPIEVLAKGPTAADALRREILVEPEGSEKELTQSVFVSLQEGDNGYSKAFKVNLPPMGTLVPGSVFAKLMVVGDVMGGTLKNLKNLVRMPSGCGEQNMINFVPNIVAMKYMKATGQSDATIENDAIRFMNKGYQKELTYQRDDGSFSAFGKNDKAGSTWLTAYVVKSFALAKEYITIEDKRLASAVNYLVSTQQTDGSFREKGKLHHQMMKGGVDNHIALAAYITVAAKMAEHAVKDDESLTTALSKSTKYVEDHLSKLEKDPYSLPIAAYALALVGSSKAEVAVNMMMTSGIRAAGYLHWGKKADNKPEPPPNMLWRRQSEPSFNIEATAYGLLAMLTAGKPLGESLPALRWLISKQNAYGGYSNTQDTVVGVDAISEFGAIGTGVNTGSLQVVGQEGGNEHRFEPITGGNRMVLQIHEMPNLNSPEVNVQVSGLGSALVQLAVKYNVIDNTEDEALIITKLDTKIVNDVTIEVETCAAWKSPEESGMVNIETKALSGYEFETDAVLNEHRKNGMKRIEVKDKILTTYWDKMTNDTQRCFKLIANKMADVDNIQKASVMAYSYYSPEQVAVQYYHPNISTLKTDFCIKCPSCCKAKLASSEGVHPPEKQLPRGSDAGKPLPDHASTLLVYSLLTMLIAIFQH